MVAQIDRTLVRAAPGRVVPRLLGYALFEGRPATTIGRWINPVVKANLHLASQFDRGRTVDSPILIVGIGRSGTTMLGQLLATHPDVGYLNEPKAIWSIAHLEDDIIGSYSETPGRLQLTDADATHEVARRLHAMYDWYLRSTRSTRVVDKYPELVHRESYVRAIFSDPKFIALVRHPWDVINSIVAWSVEHGDGEADWWGVADRKWRTLWSEVVLGDDRLSWLVDIVDSETCSDETRACIEWYVGTQAALELDAAIVVDYDDLVADPVTELRRILDGCDLSPSTRVEAVAAELVRLPSRAREMPADIPDELARRAIDLYVRTRAAR